MTADHLKALAARFYDEDSLSRTESPASVDERETWIAILSAFGTIVADAARVATEDREAAVRKISELARRNFDHLTTQDKLVGAGRTLGSIADIAAKAVGDASSLA